MKFNGSDSRCHRWGLILAGGDGKRLLLLTRRIAGDDWPKQFCAVLGNEQLGRDATSSFPIGSAAADFAGVNENARAFLLR